MVSYIEIDYFNWSVDGTLIGQSGSGNNSYKRILHILQSSKTGGSPSDEVYFHIQDTCWRVLLLGRDTIAIFYSSSQVSCIKYSNQILIICTVVECSSVAQETGVQSQVESYQRHKKWYLIPLCLTLSIIRYISRVKWSNPGKGVTPPLHLGVVAIEKGAFG